MKKFNSLLILMLLLVFFLPGRALTPRDSDLVEFDYEGMRYCIFDGMVGVFYPYDSVKKEYYSYGGDIIIPDSVMWDDTRYPVKTIWGGFGASHLTSLHIPNTVISLEPDVFAFCSGLDSINLPTPISISLDTFKDSHFSKFYYRENPDGPADSQVILNFLYTATAQIIDVASVKNLTLQGYLGYHAKKLYVHHMDRMVLKCDYLSDYTILDDTVPPIVTIIEPEYAEEPLQAPAPECILFVPDGTEDLYSEAPFWKDFSKIYPKSKLEEIEGELSGIKIVETPDESGKMSVAAEGCMIRVSKAEGECSVYDIQGRMVSSFRTDGSPVSLRMQPGVYIVVCGVQSAKVICR